MTHITITLEPDVALFYSRIALSAGVPLEQVLSDALFRLAGELSLQETKKQRAHVCPQTEKSKEK